MHYIKSDNTWRSINLRAETVVESVNSYCEKNSVHGPLLQRVAFDVKEINCS